MKYCVALRYPDFLHNKDDNFVMKFEAIELKFLSGTRIDRLVEIC